MVGWYPRHKNHATKVNVDGDDVFSYYHFLCLCLSHFLTPPTGRLSLLLTYIFIEPPETCLSFRYLFLTHPLSLSLLHFLFLLTLNAPTCHHISHRCVSFSALLVVKFRRQHLKWNCEYAELSCANKYSLTRLRSFTIVRLNCFWYIHLSICHWFYFEWKRMEGTIYAISRVRGGRVSRPNELLEFSLATTTTTPTTTTSTRTMNFCPTARHTLPCANIATGEINNCKICLQITI